MAASGLGRYQLHVSASGMVADVPQASVVVLSPEDPKDSASWLAALSTSSLTAADMRTQILLHPDVSDVTSSLLFLTVMSGFAGRVPDMLLSGSVVNSASVYRAVAAFRDEGKPADPPRLAASGSLPLRDAMRIDFSQPFPPLLVSQLRYAQSAALTFDGRPAAEMLMALVVLAGMREVRRKPRFPFVLSADTELSGEGVVLPSGSLDLESVRREAAALRRELRVDVRGAVAEAVQASEHMERMRTAAGAPLERVLGALGASRSGEAWHCPRPDRHTNGDRNPSAVLSEDGFMCHRCDLEPVDALRLVMDARSLGPSEASAWLMSLPEA